MSWDDEELTGSDDAFDELVSARLRDALGAAGPSHEAEGRMLANLLAARDARAGGGPGADAGAEPGARAGVPGGSVTDAPAIAPLEVPEVRPEDVDFTVLAGGKGRRRPWAARRRAGLAVAVAAVLAVAAVGVGALVSSQRMGSVASADLAASYDADAAYAEAAPAEEGEETSDNGADEARGAAKVTSDSWEAEGAAGGAIAADDADGALAGLGGGALTDEDDPSYPLAVDYPRIVLDTGEELEVQEHDGLPAAIGAEWLEGSLGEARALSADGSQEMACEVFLLPVSEDGLYAVRYLEGGTAYAARVVE